MTHFLSVIANSNNPVLQLILLVITVFLGSAALRAKDDDYMTFLCFAVSFGLYTVVMGWL